MGGILINNIIIKTNNQIKAVTSPNHLSVLFVFQKREFLYLELIYIFVKHGYRINIRR